MSASLTDTYKALLEALVPVCEECLFFLEGVDQWRWQVMASWGDGFATNPILVNYSKVYIRGLCVVLVVVMMPLVMTSVMLPITTCAVVFAKTTHNDHHTNNTRTPHPPPTQTYWTNIVNNATLNPDGYTGISTPSKFFDWLLSRPDILPQVVLAPHVYCPRVTLAQSNFAGPGLWRRLTDSFGYLTYEGYTSSTGQKYVFPTVIGELGTGMRGGGAVAAIGV